MEIERFPLLRVTEQGRNETEDIVTKESPLTIILNNRELVTLLCSPTNLKYLAIGFLFSEGLLRSKDEIKKIIADDRRGVVQVETRKNKEFTGELISKPLIASSGGRKASFYSASDIQDEAKVESQITIAPHEVFALVNEFQHRSRLFKATGGVHSAALCDTGGILVFSEDIGRHNAIDKVFGECILTDILMDDRVIITSGRVSSDILLKVAKGKIPILISKSAPTNLGVRLADDLGITLIGFVRGKGMNIYTNSWRVITQKHE
ncbi:MAG TPA: formate dehydrogenase accessory sulfurtransferase FdhD [Dehalococcoidia bacterium]|nr:formate dehydrogenase accessory sulfurtransferase FdhD [Dehalococcoidia bacterium]